MSLRIGNRNQFPVRRWVLWCSLLLALTLRVPAGDISYVVKSHDTLYGIASRYGISPERLAEHNGLTKGAWVYVGQHLSIPSGPGTVSPASPKDQTYVVKSHDTLYGIASRYGISPERLAEHNGLTKGAWVYVGQHLTIPPKSAARPHRAPGLDPAVQKAINAARVRRGRWKYIVIHHSGVDAGTVRSMDRYHREVRHMEHGLAYHFVIGNGHGMKDGEVAVCPRWRKQLDGGHLASPAQNKYSLGICLVGNFEKHKPSPRQMKSLVALTHALLKRCRLPISAVKTHRQINIVSTRCPGRYFPLQSFLKELRAVTDQSNT